MNKAISIILIFSVFISLNGCALATRNSPYRERIQEKTNEGSLKGGVIGGLIGLLFGVVSTVALTSGVSKDKDNSIAKQNENTISVLTAIIFIPSSMGLGMAVGSSMGRFAGYTEAMGGKNYEYRPHIPKQLNYNQAPLIQSPQPHLFTDKSFLFINSLPHPDPTF